MKITSAILLIAVDGKQQFHQVLLHEDEHKNLVELVSSGAFTPITQKIRVLDEPLIRTRKRKKHVV